MTAPTNKYTTDKGCLIITYPTSVEFHCSHSKGRYGCHSCEYRIITTLTDYTMESLHNHFNRLLAIIKNQYDCGNTIFYNNAIHYLKNRPDGKNDKKFLRFLQMLIASPNKTDEDTTLLINKVKHYIRFNPPFPLLRLLYSMSCGMVLDTTMERLEAFVSNGRMNEDAYLTHCDNLKMFYDVKNNEGLKKMFVCVEDQ